MTTQTTIVRLKNGKYVKDWQYSQGYFDVVETAKIHEAMEIDEQNFMVFFMNKGGKLLEVTITIEIKEDAEKHEEMQQRMKVEVTITIEIKEDAEKHEEMQQRMKVAEKKQKEEGKRLGKNNAIFDYL